MKRMAAESLRNSPRKQRRVDLSPEKKRMSLTQTSEIAQDEFSIYCDPKVEARGLNFVQAVPKHLWSSSNLTRAIESHSLFHFVFPDRLQMSTVQFLQALDASLPHEDWDFMSSDDHEYALRDIMAVANVTTLGLLMLLHRGTQNIILTAVAPAIARTKRKRLLEIKKSTRSCLRVSGSKRYYGQRMLDEENVNITCTCDGKELRFPVDSIQGDLILRLGIYGASIVARSLWYETSPLACVSEIQLAKYLSPRTLLAELIALASSGWKGLFHEDMVVVPAENISNVYARVPRSDVVLREGSQLRIRDM